MQLFMNHYVRVDQCIFSEIGGGGTEREYLTIPAQVEKYIANTIENDETELDHKVTVGGRATLHFIPFMTK